jgi:hypothetical protein
MNLKPMKISLTFNPNRFFFSSFLYYTSFIEKAYMCESGYYCCCVCLCVFLSLPSIIAVYYYKFEQSRNLFIYIIYYLPFSSSEVVRLCLFLMSLFCSPFFFNIRRNSGNIDSVELYDLQIDPLELENIAKEQVDKVKELMVLWKSDWKGVDTLV